VLQGQHFLGPPLTAQDDDLNVSRRLASGPDAVTFSLDCPIGEILTVNNGTPVLDPPTAVGQFTREATNDEVGEWTCSVTATDAAGANSTQSFRITVYNVNDPPTFVRVELYENTTGQLQNITQDGQQVHFEPAALLHYRAFFDDPDMHVSLAPGGGVVDPNETLFCSVGDTYQVTALPFGGFNASGSATIDAATCEGEVALDWIEWGTASLWIRATEHLGFWNQVNFQVNVTNAASCRPVASIQSPRTQFFWTATQRVNLMGSARCSSEMEGHFRFDWSIQIIGGRTYNATGFTANLTVWNDMTRDTNVNVILMVVTVGDARASQSASAFAMGRIGGSAGARPLAVHPSGAPVNLPGSLSVAFAANVEGGLAPYAFYWDFGDGTSSQEGLPIHAYGAEGNYTVTVAVTDATGFATTHAFQVHVVAQRGNTGAVWTIMFALAAVAGMTVVGAVALVWKRDGPG
jgi:hypothetical protein